MAFPGTYNISYYKGDTLESTIWPKAADGTAFPLTGYAAKAVISTALGSGAVLPTQYSATLTTGSTITVTSPAALVGVSVGQRIVKYSGTGVFGTGAYITAISGLVLTISVAHTTIGAIVFQTATSYDAYAVSNTTNSSILFSISPIVGNFLTAGTTYYYDVQISLTSTPYDLVYTLLTGTITVTDQISV